MAAKLKIEKWGGMKFYLSIAALVQVKMSSNFNCSYMAKSSLTYIPGFSVKFFFQPIYADYAYFDKRSYLNLLL
jgi:hypothetical protein